MSALDGFLVQYGLLAIFLLLLTKSIGVPIPIPADVIILAAAARAAQGKLVVWQAFLAILLALVLGSYVQFLMARGPGRGILYRFGRFIALTPTRLDAASARIQRGGVLGVSSAMLIPGVRGVAIVAAGLVALPTRRFLIGLTLGSLVFLSIHFFLGYLAGSVLAIVGHILPLGEVIPVIVILLVLAYALWAFASRLQKEARREQEAAALVEIWHEGICPACLALYAAGQLHLVSIAEQR